MNLCIEHSLVGRLKTCINCDRSNSFDVDTNETLNTPRFIKKLDIRGFVVSTYIHFTFSLQSLHGFPKNIEHYRALYVHLSRWNNTDHTHTHIHRCETFSFTLQALSRTSVGHYMGWPNDVLTDGQCNFRISAEWSTPACQSIISRVHYVTQLYMHAKTSLRDRFMGYVSILQFYDYSSPFMENLSCQ
jgi:hypothetical protein